MNTLINIDQPDALAKLISVEGEEWGRLQERVRGSPCGFYAHYRAFQRRIKYLIDYPEEQAVDAPLSEFSDVRGIHGAGGFSRYQVAANGDISILGSSLEGFPEKRMRVLDAGIPIAGTPLTSVTCE